MSSLSPALPEYASLEARVSCRETAAKEPAALVVVDAAPECSVLPRVVEQFAALGLVPSRLASRIDGDDLHIELRLDGMALDQAEYLARRLRRIIEVRAVMTASA